MIPLWGACSRNYQQTFRSLWSKPSLNTNQWLSYCVCEDCLQSSILQWQSFVVAVPYIYHQVSPHSQRGHAAPPDFVLRLCGRVCASQQNEMEKRGRKCVWWRAELNEVDIASPLRTKKPRKGFGRWHKQGSKNINGRRGVSVCVRIKHSVKSCTLTDRKQIYLPCNWLFMVNYFLTAELQRVVMPEIL